MRRGEFIKALFDPAASWPLVSGAQGRDATKRIGVLIGLIKSDTEGQARVTAAYRQLGRPQL